MWLAQETPVIEIRKCPLVDCTTTNNESWLKTKTLEIGSLLFVENRLISEGRSFLNSKSSFIDWIVSAFVRLCVD